MIFGVTVFGALAGSLSGLDWIPGALFVVGCMLAVLSVRPPDLLGLVVSPPITFFVVVLCGELLGGDEASGAATGLFARLLTSLISAAPWLFLGTLLVLGIAMLRGLPASLRELNGRLLAEREANPANPANPAGTDKPRGRRRRGPARGRRSASSPAGRWRHNDPSDDEDPVRWDEAPPI